MAYLDFDYGGGRGAHGTGWFIDDSHIATVAHNLNRHLARDDSEMTVYTHDGETVPAEIVNRELGFTSSNEYIEFAVLETSGNVPYSFTQGNSEELTGEDELLQVGHPLSLGTWIGALGRFLNDDYGPANFNMEISSAGGNSGSRVVTLDGRVVG